MGRKDDSVNAAFDAYHQATGSVPDSATQQALNELAEELMEEEDEQ